MRITMQYKMFLIKYAEIGTKGKNRYVFEEIMCKRMRARLKPLGKFEVRREYGRIFVEAFSDYDYEDVMKVLTTIFGIVGAFREVCDKTFVGNLQGSRCACGRRI